MDDYTQYQIANSEGEFAPSSDDASGGCIILIIMVIVIIWFLGKLTG